MDLNLQIQSIQNDRVTMSLDRHANNFMGDFCISYKSEDGSNANQWLIPKRLINFDNLRISRFFSGEQNPITFNFKNGSGIIQLRDVDSEDDVYIGQEVKIVKKVDTIEKRVRQKLVPHKIDAKYKPDDYVLIRRPTHFVADSGFNIYNILKSLNVPLFETILDLPELSYVKGINLYDILSRSYIFFGGGVSLDVGIGTFIYGNGVYIAAMHDGSYKVFFKRIDIIEFITGEPIENNSWMHITGREKNIGDIKWIAGSSDTTLQSWTLNILDDSLKTYHEVSKLTGQKIHVNVIDEKYINEILNEVKPEDRTTEDLNKVIAHFYGLEQIGHGRLSGCLNPDIYNPGDLVVTQVAKADLYMTATEEDTIYSQSYWIALEGFKPAANLRDDLPF